MMQARTISHVAAIFSLLHLLEASKCHVSVSNIALNGYVFASFHVENMHFCYRRCQEKIGCLSINYYIDSFVCELNNRTIAAKSRMKEVNFNAVYFERLQPAAIGSHEELPADSCMEIKTALHTPISSLHWVKHAQQTAKIYCNMTNGASEPCFSSPCQNQGKCHKVNEITYNCSCVSPFNGKNCETKQVIDSWQEYTAYWCTHTYRHTRVEGLTKEQCKAKCTGDCKAMEWWGTGPTPCYFCTDPSKRQFFTNTKDGAYPPSVLVRS